jgi:hypothetical protein
MTNSDGGLRVSRIRLFLKSHLVLILILVTLCGLALFPIADCFDCEGPNAWGRNDAAYEIRANVFDVWLVGTSLLVGFLRQRRGYFVPIAAMLIYCATMPLGGVKLWSLFGNEGPTALIIGLPVGLCSFAVGRAVRELNELFMRKLVRHH